MELPESLGQLSSLEELFLVKNNFVRIPESIMQLSKLKFLNLSYSERLQSLLKLPCSLLELDAHHCTVLDTLSGLIFSSYEIDLSCNFKLDRNEARGIVEDALQEIQLMAAAHWKEAREEVCL